MSGIVERTEWRKYRSHKVVEAAPICAIEDVAGELAILVKPYADDPHRVEQFEPTEKAMIAHAEIGGYALRYPDGYKSVSPKKAFEEGFSMWDGTTMRDGFSLGMHLAAQTADTIAQQYRSEGKDEIVGALTAFARVLRG